MIFVSMGCVFATIGNRSNQTFYGPAEYDGSDGDPTEYDRKDSRFLHKQFIHLSYLNFFHLLEVWGVAEMSSQDQLLLYLWGKD